MYSNNKYRLKNGDVIFMDEKQIGDEKFNVNKVENNTKINILHLSDIHLGSKQNAETYINQLRNDLWYNLNVNRLDYIVISGDIGKFSLPEEYHAACYLISEICKDFKLDFDKVIIAPGNHDLNWDLAKKAYPSKEKLHVFEKIFKKFNQNDGKILEPKQEILKLRFDNFNTYFYKMINGNDYPVEYAEQGIIQCYKEDKILFLTLNSCWQIDHLNLKNQAINMDAINGAISKIKNKYDDYLKIVIFHHPIFSNEKIKDESPMKQFSQIGFQIHMHGHIHQAKKIYYEENGKSAINTIGAGTFGAPASEQVSGIPLQYNLLIFDKIKHQIKVNTRKKIEPNGAWEPDAIYYDKNRELKPYYYIPLTIKRENEKFDYFSIPELNKDFVNRQSEQRKLIDSLDNKHIIIIRGMAGVGKTDLAATIGHNLKNNDYNIYWTEIRPCDSFNSLTRNIAKFLSKNGYYKLLEYIENNVIDFTEIVNYLIEALNYNKYILFFDNYHVIEKKQKIKIDELFYMLGSNLKDSTIIITSRYKPEFINRFKYKQNIILDEKIEVFDLSTVSEYLSMKKVQLTPGQFNKIKKIITHPFTLDFFAKNIERKDINEIVDTLSKLDVDKIKEFLIENVLNDLSEEKREILDVISVFRSSVDYETMEFIIHKDKVMEQNILDLNNQSLLKKQAYGYNVHDILKKYCYSMMSISKRKSLHKSIGEYYMSLEIQPEYFLEASHHLIKNNGIIDDDIIEYFLKAPNDLYYIFIINEFLKEEQTLIDKNNKIFDLFDKFILSNNIEIVNAFILEYGDYFNKIHSIDEDASFEVYHKIIESYTDEKVLGAVSQSVKSIAKNYPVECLDIWKKVVNVNKQLAVAIVGFINDVNIKSEDYINFLKDILHHIPDGLKQYYIGEFSRKWGLNEYQHARVSDHLKTIRELYEIDVFDSLKYIEETYKLMNPWFSVQILSEFIKLDKHRVMLLLRNIVDYNKKTWPMMLFHVSDILSMSLGKNELNNINIFLNERSDKYSILVGIRTLDLLSNSDKFETKELLDYLNPFLEHDNTTIQKIAKNTERIIKKDYKYEIKQKNFNSLMTIVKICVNPKGLVSMLKTGFCPTEQFTIAVWSWGTIKTIEKYDTDEILKVGESALINENPVMIDGSNWAMHKLQAEPDKFVEILYKYGFKDKETTYKYVSVPWIILMGNLVPETVNYYLKKIMLDEDEAVFSLIGNLRFYKNQEPQERKNILNTLCSHNNKDISGFADFLLNGI